MLQISSLLSQLSGPDNLLFLVKLVPPGVAPGALPGAPGVAPGVLPGAPCVAPGALTLVTGVAACLPG